MSRCGCRERDFIRQHRRGRCRRGGRRAVARAGAGRRGRAQDPSVKWSKAPCRFCGTGCGVTVAVKDNRVVATHGDPQAEVNSGLNCVKGYFLSKIMYGEDRLTTPLLRMKDGQYAKDGEFQRVSWDQAFDVMAEQFKRVLKDKGPTAVGMFGSGQWTVWEGYAALKLMKAGFRSNNLDPNARHCMASAAVGLHAHLRRRRADGLLRRHRSRRRLRAVGLQHGRDAPVLWTRVTDRRLSAPNVKVAVLSTFEHRSYELADIELTFTPQTDLAILNYIAHHIISTGRVNKDFVDKHTTFLLGNADIGYGLRPEHPLQKAAKNAGDAGGSKPMTFDEFAKFVSTYDLDYTAKLSGVPKNRLQALAELYADPKVKVMSFWTMGFNQHTRGVWCNNMVYNIHLLTGKISTPGNSPFSLTGQPSACGTAREVGTFAHRLPADMVVTNPKHRARDRGDLEAAAGHHPRRAGLPRGAAEPHAQGRQAQRLLGDGQQQHAGGGQPDAGGLPRLPQPGQLRRRLRRLPDRHRGRRRPDPAGGDVGREGRRLRQRRTAHALLAPAVSAHPARRAPTCGS